MAGRTLNTYNLLNTTHTLAKRASQLQCYAVLAITILISTNIQAQSDPQGRELNTIKIISDSQQIYLGDSLTIDVESIGLLEELDISPLLAHSDFVRETKGTMISVIGGEIVEINVWRIELVPRKIGLLVLGPLRGETTEGSVTSNAYTVKVEATPNEKWTPEPKDLDLSVTVSKSNPFVGEQFELTIQLSHQYAVASEIIKLPEFPGFDITRVYEERRLVDSETDMRTTTWRYLLNAQRSGVFELTGPSWKATLIRSRVQRYDFNITHSPIRLDITAVPDRYPENAWWLAAESLSMSDSWSSNVTQLSAGDEIVRTINLEARGVLANHLPVVKPLATRSFHSTPLPVQRSDEHINNSTHAKGVYEFRMIAESPVPVFLDTVRVPWFNTKTRTIEEAIIPSRRIDILLPTRPDQLAELAIKRHGLNRFRLWLSSFSIQQWILLTLGIVVTALCFTKLNPYHFKNYTDDFQRLKQRFQWRFWATTSQWERLYDALIRLPSPFQNNNAIEPLTIVLGGLIYSDSTRASNSDIKRAIKPYWKRLLEKPTNEEAGRFSDDLPAL